MSDGQASIPDERRGMSVARRVAAGDAYGILLLLLIASIQLRAIPLGSVGQLLRTGFLGLVLLFALRTSRSSRRIQLVGLALLLAGVVSALPLGRDSDAERAVLAAVELALSALAVVAVAYRIGVHPRISRVTVAAALCIYVTAAMVFAGAYGLVGALDDGPTFRGNDVGLGGDGTALERTYFSLVTITTLGYGDLTPANDTVRMLAVTEALVGQVYLVTVVALVIGNLGRVRPGGARDGSEEPT